MIFCRGGLPATAACPPKVSVDFRLLAQAFFLFSYRGRVSESESGSKGKTQWPLAKLGSRDYTVGEHSMEYGEVKTDPDSDTDANPE